MPAIEWNQLVSAVRQSAAHRFLAGVWPHSGAAGWSRISDRLPVQRTARWHVEFPQPLAIRLAPGIRLSADQMARRRAALPAADLLYGLLHAGRVAPACDALARDARRRLHRRPAGGSVPLHHLSSRGLDARRAAAQYAGAGCDHPGYGNRAAAGPPGVETAQVAPDATRLVSPGVAVAPAAGRLFGGHAGCRAPTAATTVGGSGGSRATCWSRLLQLTSRS